MVIEVFVPLLPLEWCWRHSVFWLSVCLLYLILKVLNTISYQLLRGISSNLQLWCSRAHRWTD